MVKSFRTTHKPVASVAIALGTLLLFTREAGSTAEAPRQIGSSVVASFGLQHDPFLFGAWPPYHSRGTRLGFGLTASVPATVIRAPPVSHSLLTALTRTIAGRFERAVQIVRADPFLSEYFGQFQEAAKEPMRVAPDSFFVESGGSRWLYGSTASLATRDDRGLHFEMIDAALFRPRDIVVQFSFTVPTARSTLFGLRINATADDQDMPIAVALLNHDTGTFQPTENGAVGRTGAHVGPDGTVRVRVRLPKSGLFETQEDAAMLDELTLEFTPSGD